MVKGSYDPRHVTRNARSYGKYSHSPVSITIIMMYIRRALSWLWNTSTSKIQDFILGILAAGPIPKHVAFVMDGNRRYARRNGKNVHEGHSEGFVALKRVHCSLLLA